MQDVSSGSTPSNHPRSNSPATATTTYVVAVKYAERKNAPPDLIEQIARIEGVNVPPLPPGASRPSSQRVRIEATEAGRAELERQFGSLCHIEPIIRHHTCGGTNLSDATLPSPP